MRRKQSEMRSCREEGACWGCREQRRRAQTSAAALVTAASLRTCPGR